MRQATPARLFDLPALAALEALCFKHPGERFSRRVIRGLLRNPRAVVRTARVDGRLIGWAAGLLRQRGAASSGRLYALAVHPEFRGKHWGETLAIAALDLLRRRGATRFSLEVGVRNQGARRLYEKLGFRPSGLLPDYYGPGLHGLRMRRQGVVIPSAARHLGVTG